MRSVSRLIVVIFMLMVMVSWAVSQEPVKLNGSEGMSLLARLTNSPPGLDNSTKNLNNSNSIQKPTAYGRASGDLWSWGSKPKDPQWAHEEEDDYLNESNLFPV